MHTWQIFPQIFIINVSSVYSVWQNFLLGRSNGGKCLPKNLVLQMVFGAAAFVANEIMNQARLQSFVRYFYQIHHFLPVRTFRFFFVYQKLYSETIFLLFSMYCPYTVFWKQWTNDRYLYSKRTAEAIFRVNSWKQQITLFNFCSCTNHGKTKFYSEQKVNGGESSFSWIHS